VLPARKAPSFFPQKAGNQIAKQRLRRLYDLTGRKEMSIRTLALCAIASLFLGGGAVAQTSTQAPGATSGPAAGGNVNPSAAIQKNRSSATNNNNVNKNNDPSAAGAPGVEGPAGSENGPSQGKMK